MDEERALVPIKVMPPAATLPTKDELNIIGTIAKTVVEARGHAVPAGIDSPAKAAAVMLAGWELGVKPMTALRHVFVVNGRTEPDAQLMAGIVMAKEPAAAFTWIERSEKRAAVRLDRPNRDGIISEYTIADAERAGQMGKPGPWKQYTRDMLAWAALKRACRIGAPDLINQVASFAVDEAAGFIPEGHEGNGAIVEALPPEQLYSDGDDPEPEVEDSPRDVLNQEAWRLMNLCAEKAPGDKEWLLFRQQVSRDYENSFGPGQAFTPERMDEETLAIMVAYLDDFVKPKTVEEEENAQAPLMT